MPAFKFSSITLVKHPKSSLPGEHQGWVIIGTRADSNKQEILATLSTEVDDWLAERWADLAAKNLAGQSSAVIEDNSAPNSN